MFILPFGQFGKLCQNCKMPPKSVPTVNVVTSGTLTSFCVNATPTSSVFTPAPTTSQPLKAEVTPFERVKNTTPKITRGNRGKRPHSHASSRQNFTTTIQQTEFMTSPADIEAWKQERKQKYLEKILFSKQQKPENNPSPSVEPSQRTVDGPSQALVNEPSQISSDDLPVGINSEKVEKVLFLEEEISGNPTFYENPSCLAESEHYKSGITKSLQVNKRQSKKCKDYLRMTPRVSLYEQFKLQDARKEPKTKENYTSQATELSTDDMPIELLSDLEYNLPK